MFPTNNEWASIRPGTVLVTLTVPGVPVNPSVPPSSNPALNTTPGVGSFVGPPVVVATVPGVVGDGPHGVGAVVGPGMVGMVTVGAAGAAVALPASTSPSPARD